MQAVAFDTLRYYQTLVKAGVEECHAEAMTRAHADATKHLVDQKLVTKIDLQQVRQELHTEIQGVRQELHIEIQGVRQELHTEIHQVHTEIHEVRKDMSSLFVRTLVFMTGLISVAVTVLIAVLK
ncbi:MAG: hypothetical protein Tsb005_13930 [Gammaproteobacteria bacterium]